MTALSLTILLLGTFAAGICIGASVASFVYAQRYQALGTARQPIRPRPNAAPRRAHGARAYHLWGRFEGGDGMNMIEDTKQWCILRTSSRTTIGLAESLAKDGFDVWTPIETVTMTVPRANVKRQVRLPIMPTYVFAASDHLRDLLDLAAMPVRPRRGAGLMDAAHAGFHVLRCFGGIPIIQDAHLASLRRIEAKRAPRPRAASAFPKNVHVKVNGGAFGGMTGLVESSTPAVTMVDFGLAFPAKLPTSILSLHDIEGVLSSSLQAA